MKLNTGVEVAGLVGGSNNGFCSIVEASGTLGSPEGSGFDAALDL